MTEFKTGDVVELNSGGLRMTVRWSVVAASDFAEVGLHCDWFDLNGCPRSRVYLPAQVRLVSPKDEEQDG